MSELKLNLVDAENILSGSIHGSIANYCVAALSAEPETIAELEIALARFRKPHETISVFSSFRSQSEIDPSPHDAGLVVVDLAARVVASESTYSQPGPDGQVRYHDGKQLTDVPINYLLPPDWLFVNSVEAYRWSAERRRAKRQANPPLDARAVIYGLPLIEFLVNSAGELRKRPLTCAPEEDPREAMERQVVRIHANWLTTARPDLRGRSPREVMLEKRDLIDSDLDSRSLQWTVQGEGPPCLPADSVAYRYAGFGTHEWVVYYDLVRQMLWTAVAARRPRAVSSSISATLGDNSPVNERRGIEPGAAEDYIDVPTLEQIKNAWLEHPWSAYDGRTPAIIIENERRRLPVAMSPRELIIDEDCECCRMLARDAEIGQLFGTSMDATWKRNLLFRLVSP